MGNCHCRSCPPKTEASVEGELAAALAGDAPLNAPPAAPEAAVEQQPAVSEAATLEAQARARRGVRATAAALRVRTLAEESVEAAWTKLQAEFDVQKMVWESVGLGRGVRHQGAVAMLQSKVDFALSTRKHDSANALAALQAALERSVGETGLLNRSMETSMRECINAEALVAPRQQLASLLEGDLGPVNEVPLSELRELLNSCALEAKLKESVQKAIAAKSEG